MRRIPVSRKVLALLFVLAGCGHEASRVNPLDSELTPPVVVDASIDSAGTVTLTWSRYAGDSAFDAYHVLRNVVRSTVVETLAVATAVDSTRFVDSGLQPDAAYEYRVIVENQGGLRVESERQRVDGFSVRPVILSPPAADPRAGSVQLSWSRYRDPGFTSYTVVRHTVGTDTDSAIATSTAVNDTVFADTTALHGVDYSYRVVTTAEQRPLDSNSEEARLDLPAVTIETLDFDSATASATLTWLPYEGPRFQSYEIWRTTGPTRERIRAVDSADMLSLQEVGLRGATPYAYQVDVVTTRGERSSSRQEVGSFHTLVGQWDLDLLGSELAIDEFVRLYARPANQIEALVARRVQATVLRRSYDADGGLAETETLLDLLPGLADDVFSFRPRGFSSYDGPHRLLSTVGGEGVYAGMYALGELGERLGEAVSLSIDVTADGEVPTLEGVFVASSDPSGGSAVIGSVAVRTGSGESIPLLEEYLLLDRRQGVQLRDEGDWGDYGVTLDILVYDDDTGLVRLGAVDADQLTVVFRGREVEMRWTSASGDTVRATAPWPHYTSNDVRRVVIEPAEQGFRLTARGHAVWAARSPHAEWTTSLADLEGSLALTVGARAYRVHADYSVDSLSGEFPAAVTETRTWRVDGEDVPFVAVCMPQIDEVRVGRVSRPSSWNRTLNTTVGPFLIEGEADRLFYPMSVAGSRDGRIYVLDAGNARIVVLDRDGNYVTNFGSRGDGPGEFNFLDGSTLGNVGRNFAGSIAVDDDGFIYVADVGNGRMQKFAP